MRIGFTGTRYGMTSMQLERVAETFMGLAKEGDHDTELHHGDCVGADTEAHHIAYDLGFRLVIHPPENAKLRAWNKGNVTHAPIPYLRRNRAIVKATDVLVAAPASVLGQRSGTWTTVRYAHNLDRRVLVIAPDGSIQS